MTWEERLATHAADERTASMARVMGIRLRRAGLGSRQWRADWDAGGASARKARDRDAGVVRVVGFSVFQRVLVRLARRGQIPRASEAARLAEHEESQGRSPTSGASGLVPGL